MPAISAAMSAPALPSAPNRDPSCSRSARSARLLCSIRSESSTTRDVPPRCARYRSGPRWTPGGRLSSSARSTWPRSTASARCAARLRWSIRSDRPARSSAPLAAVSHACRVFASHSLFNERVFSAPPFSGLALLARLNHCSASRAWPSRPRSEIIRWTCGLSPPPR